MCGIAGIIGWEDQAANRAAMRRMLDKLAHRGPDGEGILTEGKATLGHRRLAILDLSEAGLQPMTDFSGRYHIVLNGEIYNFKALRAELSDYPYRSETDTEVLLAAYRKWGKDFLGRLEGMFSLAIWDKEEEYLLLARDRMGIKPIYLWQEGTEMLFASEIRSILSAGKFTARLDPDALSDYLSYQTVHGSRSMVQGIELLAAGTAVEWRKGQISRFSWWEMPGQGSGEAGEMSPENVRKRVRELLLQGVEKRLVADVPLGAFLSGGIDSSAVVGLMAEVSEQPVETFSVVFEEEKYDESAWSGQVAKKFRTNHHPILLRPERFLEELPNALAALDHPSSDGINSYVVSQVTREAGITVALSGLGGDELFAGYPIFNQLPEIRQKGWLWALPGPVRQLLLPLAGIVPGGRRGEQIARVLSLPGKSVADIYPAFRTIFTPQLKQLILESPRIDYNGVRELLMGQPGLTSAASPELSRISMAEISTYTRNVLLRDTDQMSMAQALEVRVPFFDHKLVEFVLGIPDAQKRPAYPKQLLVESLGDLLPHDVVHRKKMGFLFPWEQWLRGELKGFATERLDRLGQRKGFRGEALRKLGEEFQAGKGPLLWVHIWLLVILEDWLERNGVEL